MRQIVVSALEKATLTAANPSDPQSQAIGIKHAARLSAFRAFRDGVPVHPQQRAVAAVMRSMQPFDPLDIVADRSDSSSRDGFQKLHEAWMVRKRTANDRRRWKLRNRETQGALSVCLLAIPHFACVEWRFGDRKHHSR